MEFQTYRVHGRGGNRGGSEGVREGSLENDVFRPSFLPPFPCTTTIILGSVPRAPTYSRTPLTRSFPRHLMMGRILWPYLGTVVGCRRGVGIGLAGGRH